MIRYEGHYTCLPFIHFVQIVVFELHEWTVEIHGDALKEFLVPGGQYILEVIVNNIFN